ncbi:MAG: RagB/SusD family nutrient uptake outer membrane protein [Cytophagaceae bacterium]|nr:RagB/SusD family nutrient uptake outer membrane protein [Cytophagaceae bacterium]
MKRLRNFKFILAAGLLLGSQSCKDLLVETPISQVSSAYLDTPAGFESAIRAVYTSLRAYYGRETTPTLGVFGTDTYTMGADGSYKFVNQYTSQLDGRLDMTRNLWNEFYVAINNANAVINRADKIAGIDPTIKKRRVAEVKFLRAHHYFLLVQIFGPVALVLEENTEAKKEFTRAPVKDVYAAIIADLESALTDIGTPTSDYGLVTKGAVEHLLARVYLTKATDKDAAAAGDFVKAGTYAQNVIKNYSYKLLPDFAKVFEQGGGEINDEVIFACQYTSDPLTNGPGNQWHLYYGMEYDTQPGMQRDVVNGRPFKRFRPTDYMLNVVFAIKDRVNDSRYKKTFKDTWLSNRPGTYNAAAVLDPSKKTLTFAAGDTAIFIPGVEWTVAERAAKKYSVLVPSFYKPNLFPTLQKFFDPLRPDRTYEQGSRDVLVFRLAETQLIAAEALLKQGKAAEALPFINAVRRRAAWPGKEAAMTLTVDQLSMETIYEERERELAGETLRWYDLKRWGILVERVKKYNPDAAPNIKDFHLLRPIPQDQIDRTKNGKDAFPQNPGY